MSDPPQEPTMEEILASIRRIISEDDTPESTASAPPPPVEEPPPPPPSEPEPSIPLDDDFGAMAASDFDDDSDELELVDKVETHGDLDIYSTPVEPAPESELPDLGALVSPPAAAVAAAAFG